MQLNDFSRRKFLKTASFLAFLPGDSSLSGGLLPPIFSGSEVSDQERINALLKQKDPVKWVFAGDSITMGVKHTHGHQAFPNIFEERIRWELQRMRDIVINTGVSGNTTQNVLEDFEWRITQFKPSVVSLMLGTNDCGGYKIEDFEKNMNLLLIKIKQINAIPILHTPSLVIPERSPGRKRLPEFASVVREVAEKNNVILVDNWSHWENTLRDQPEVNVYKNWLNDPAHPNQTGHQEIARLMFRKLSIFDPLASTCGGNYYKNND